jgi:uncharacterized membrane protein YcaP (DUF421 family)
MYGLAGGCCPGDASRSFDRENPADGDHLTGGIIGAVTLVAVNSGVNRLIAVSATARVFDGRATTVISDGHVVDRALRRLGMRGSELNTAVHLQGADDIAEVGRGSLEPGGQLVLTLKKGEQSATKSDIAELVGHLRRIENLLSAPQ